MSDIEIFIHLEGRGTSEAPKSSSSIFAFGIPYLNELFSNSICRRCKKGALVVESSYQDQAKLLILKCQNCHFQLIQEVHVNEMPIDSSLNTNPDDALYLRSRLNTDGQVSNPSASSHNTKL